MNVDGSVLVQARGGQLSLVDPANGSTRWRFPAEREGDRPFYATPVVDGDAVYVVDYRGRVTRLEVGGGQPIEAWSVDVEQQVVATPLLMAGSLYVATEDGRIEVIDANSGDRLETVQASDVRLWGSPVGAQGALYVTDFDQGATLALGTGGDRIWEQEATGASAADLVLEDRTLYVGSFDRHLHALDVEASGGERWSFRGDGWFMGRPLAEGEALYAATMRGSVYALDRASGGERWSYTLDGAEFRAAPALVDDRLVVVARDGRIVLLDPASGAEEARYEIDAEGNFNAHPLVDGDSLFLLSSKHRLYEFDVATGAVRAIPVDSE